MRSEGQMLPTIAHYIPTEYPLNHLVLGTEEKTDGIQFLPLSSLYSSKEEISWFFFFFYLLFQKSVTELFQVVVNTRKRKQREGISDRRGSPL